VTDKVTSELPESGKMAGGRRLRVVMVTGGSPPTGWPVQRGIFNTRAAIAISQVVDLSLVRLRAWKPGRPVAVKFIEDDIPGVCLAMPYVPFATPINLELFKRWGWRYVKETVRSCDIIHSVYASSNGVVASYWAKRANVHHVANVIGSDFYIDLAGSRWTRSASGWQHHVHAVACESRAMTEEFLRMYPAARNVRTIYRGVDLKLFNPSCPPTTLRTDSGLRFLFLGGFPHYPGPQGSDTKGGWTLCKAWKAAEPEMIAADARLSLAGPDTPSPQLDQWLRTLNQPERIRILGNVTPAKMPNLLCSCDVVLIPSFVEGLPNVVLEAAACGRVVVGSRIGGLEDVIENGDTGVLVAPGEVSAWKDALVSQTRLHRGASLSSMGERARKYVEMEFDSGRYPFSMLDLYRQALSEPLAPASICENGAPIGGSRSDFPSPHGGGVQ
jgi:glycosyltransferase involved in cell wall biosynthesis